MQIRQADANDTASVGNLVHGLLCELDPGGADSYGLEDYRKRAETVLGMADRNWAFLASEDGTDTGVIVLNECTAIYANGFFGEITELYVLPEFRSQGTALQLLKAAQAFGQDREWTRLEVGAPPLPDWQRTVDFYLRSGFETVGPRLRIML